MTVTLKEKLATALQDKTDLESELERLREFHQTDRDFLTNQSDRLRRLIVDLVQEERTLKMRYQWLEEAAHEVCTSCEDHQPGAIVRLADEIGLDLAKELP